MTDTLAIALAQLNPTVGDLEGNKALILRARAEAAAQSADLVVCTELVVTGYPPEDLVLKPMFQEQTRAVVEALAAKTADGGPALLVGAPWVEDGKLYNAVLLLDGGRGRGAADTSTSCPTTASSTRCGCSRAPACRARFRFAASGSAP